MNVFGVHSIEGRFNQTFVIKARVFRDRERKYEKEGERERGATIATELSHFLSVVGSRGGCNGWFESERMSVVTLEDGMEAVTHRYQDRQGAKDRRLGLIQLIPSYIHLLAVEGRNPIWLAVCWEQK